MRLQLAWRLLVVLAIVLYVAVVFGVVLLIVHNLGLALLVGFTVTLLAYAGWVLFAGSEKHRKSAVFLGAAALVGIIVEMFVFLSEQQNRRALLVVAGLTLVYLGIISIGAKRYWSSMRQFAMQGGDTAHFKNPYLIINPKSGNGRAINAHVDDLARQQGIQVLMTRKDVDVETIAREAVAAGADVLGVSGGDGSIGAVAKVALEHNLPMVVLPGGTRCHFARDLGMDPKQIADSLAGFTGVERRVDVGEINGRIFLNNASFGLYADIVDHPEYREHKLQVSREVLRSIVDGSKQPYDLRFAHDDINIDRAVQVLVGVNRYDTLKISELGHRERLNEGVLHVIAFTKLNNQLMGQLVKAMSFKKSTESDEVPGLYQWVDDSFVISGSGKQLVVGVDGEREVYQTPVKIRIVPGALRIFVPAEGVRSRRKNPLSTSFVRKAWHVATE